MAIKILTDSASDITQEEAAKLGITVIPLVVTFGETSYRDGVDLDHSGFYSKLIETDEFPKTSQVTPFEFEGYYKKLTENGDTVLCITLSSKLSGCFQSANIAAEDFEGKVRVIDSLNVTVGQRILIEMALDLIGKGLSIDEIATKLEEEKKYIHLIALLDTLEYLKKGGRISATVASAGTLLNIKPVVAVVDGEVIFLGMARGSKNGNNKLMELVKKENGINFSKPLSLAYTGHSRAMLDKYIEDSTSIYEDYIKQGKELPIHTVGCTIGTHIGPGAIALAFFAP
ncbi:MAG: DegV family protein [Lachnospiraceae bacterium]|nr:DegV family protein [Lachnospiraceae bacterium]